MNASLAKAACSNFSASVDALAIHMLLPATYPHTLQSIWDVCRQHERDIALLVRFDAPLSCRCFDATVVAVLLLLWLVVLVFALCCPAGLL